MMFFLFILGMFFLPFPAQALPLRLFLEFDAPQKDIYIGQETFFSVRVFDRLGLSDITVIPPDWNNTDVFLQENPLSEPVIKNDIPYTVNELRFSMVVKMTGSIFFTPLCMTAFAPSMISVRDLPESVSVSPNGDIQICTPPFFIEVKPLPEHSPSLFAAESVELFDGISPKAVAVQAGTPIKRSLMMAAKGTLPAFLPDIKVDDIPDVSVYNGKTERTSPPQKDKLIAALRQTIIFIPKKAGEFFLPEIKVPWMNTKTGKIEVSVAPAYKMIVLPSKEVAENKEEDASLNPVEEKTQTPYFTVFVYIISSFAFFVLFVFFIVRRRRQKAEKFVKAIEKACGNGDMEKTAASLLLWAAKRFPEHSFLNLADVRKLFEGRADDFVAKLRELEHYLYGTGRFAKHLPMTGKKLGEEIFSAFQEAARLKYKKQKKEKKNLPALYPEPPADEK